MLARKKISFDKSLLRSKPIRFRNVRGIKEEISEGNMERSVKIEKSDKEDDNVYQEEQNNLPEVEIAY